LGGDTVGETLHGNRPAAQVRQHHLGDVGVVLGHVRLGDLLPVAFEQHLVRPADLHAGDRVHGVHRASRTTSRAFLSLRSPRYRGWRSIFAAVHSVNATSATFSGRAQCTPRLGSLPRVQALRLISRSESMRCNSRRTSSVNPVPTLPAYTNSPDSS